MLRYLATFGPATPADAQAWSGMSGLRDTFESLRPRLVTFRDARKRELFDLPDAPRPDEDTPVPVRFVPDFDNLVLSHDDRTRIMADEHCSRVTLKNLQVRATFLVDGLVAGTWKSERKRKAAVLLIEPFGTIAKRVRAALEAGSGAAAGVSRGGCDRARGPLGVVSTVSGCGRVCHVRRGSFSGRQDGTLAPSLEARPAPPRVGRLLGWTDRHGAWPGHSRLMERDASAGGTWLH